MASRSRLLVTLMVAAMVAAVVAGLLLRTRLRCAGFAGPAPTVAELPPPVPAGALRIATWNLRNFPLDERPDVPDLGYSRLTNICDLEKVLGRLDAGIAAFQEVNDTRRFPPILQRAGGPEQEWRVLFARTGGRFGQRVAVAWDDRRFELTHDPISLDELVVEDGARPGLAVHLASLAGDLDLTVVSIHLEATARAWPRRKLQLEALEKAISRLVTAFDDQDVVVLGDFNSSGWQGGTAEEELDRADQILAASGLRRIVNATGCTDYWEGSGGRDGVFVPAKLDHVYLRGLADMTDLQSRSWLHCQRLACGDLVSMPGAEDGTFFDVSDHCPVTVDLRLD